VAGGGAVARGKSFPSGACFFARYSSPRSTAARDSGVYSSPRTWLGIRAKPCLLFFFASAAGSPAVGVSGRAGPAGGGGSSPGRLGMVCPAPGGGRRAGSSSQGVWRRTGAYRSRWSRPRVVAGNAGNTILPTGLHTARPAVDWTHRARPPRPRANYAARCPAVKAVRGTDRWQRIDSVEPAPATILDA